MERKVSISLVFSGQDVTTTTEFHFFLTHAHTILSKLAAAINGLPCNGLPVVYIPAQSYMQHALLTQCNQNA